LQQQHAAGEDQQRTPPHQPENAGCVDIGHLARDRAMGLCDIDFAFADPAKRQHGRDSQNEGDDKDRATGQQITASAHQRCSRSIAERGKAGVAAKPLADRRWADQTEADRSDGRTEHAARGGVQRGSRNHDRKNRPYRISERAGSDRRNREARHQPFGAGGIDNGTAGHLPDQTDQAADRQHKADFDLGPFLRRKIHRDEWAEPGLHIGQKEDEPVEAAQALARRGWRGARRHRLRDLRRNVSAADRARMAIASGPVNRMGWTYGQDIAPPC